jgi:hypothetical protein
MISRVCRDDGMGVENGERVGAEGFVRMFE